MIKANELRIGNKVMANRFEDDEPWETTVEEIQDMQITASLIPRGGTWVKYEDLEPIPLTPEWLERMGFVKNTREEWDGPKIELEHSLEWFTIKGYGPDSFMLMGSEWTMGKPFQFVHQLQNLYFAVTGEELDIKL